MLNHGGRLNQAAKKFNIPVENWIDLSTGINPYHWPLPQIPDDCFTRLPEDDDGLIKAAQQYYQTGHLLAVAGSQAVIQLLPHLREKSKVAVPAVGYAEHAYQWKKAGHDVVFYQASDLEKIINTVDVLIIINPNNPGGELYQRQHLIEWHQQLQTRQGWLIVDEAFIDAEVTAVSVVDLAHTPGLIVLRSVGKFFGLAGIRSGFVFAEQALLDNIKESLGPWSLSAVSRYITKLALSDRAWQQQMTVILQQSSQKLDQLIVRYSGQKPAGTHLFKTLMHTQAEQLAQLFAEKAVLVRLLDNRQGIRLGLPKETQWQQLELVFSQVFRNINSTQQKETRRTA
ncbi:MAG: threonine-phosphate decarboxylase CobD [Gammaproteobacteria bacterium]|nr:threonine-phosphate decarboxylase CobD [Gammaproteobacteria bacterium]